MLSLSELHTLADFGMCVVLWLVQLVIYPSFLRIEGARLVKWHKTYTFRVSFVIIPLMFGQMALALWTILDEPSVFEWAAFFMILLCWVLTFAVSVPLHRKMNHGDRSDLTITRLIQTNWPRTILWTAIFLLGLAQ